MTTSSHPIADRVSDTEAGMSGELPVEALAAFAGSLGIVTRPTGPARAAQQSLGLDITEGNADGTDEIPMPTTVLVDESGVIRWIDVHPDYSTRTEPTDVLGAIDRERLADGCPAGHDR